MVGSVLVISMVAGHPAVAELIGGFVVLVVAMLLGMNLAARAVAELDPGRRLILDLLIVGVILLALVGMAVIGLAIPVPG